MSLSPSASGKPVDKSRQSNSRSRSPSPTKKTVIETRRAEQNRAAQRAFRQRKELYVKELEAKVNHMADWSTRMEQLENENEQLKRKIAQLEQEHEQDHEHEHEHEKNIKKSFTSASSSSPSTTTAFTKKLNTSEQQQHTEPKRPSQPKQAGDKGKVLDDLVSILKTRNRPPIQYHQYQPPNV